MLAKDMDDIVGFIEESFADGKVTRELRLSRKEIEYIKSKYPSISFKEMPLGFCEDGKLWVEVSFTKADFTKDII